MALSRNKKEGYLEDYKHILKTSESILFVNINSINSKENSDLRADLKKSEIGFKVIKKSIFRLALKDAEIKGQVPSLDKEIAICFGSCPTSPAREIANSKKSLKEKIEIKGGILSGAFKAQDEMIAISKIPDLLTLKAQFVNIINSPIQRCAIALSEIAKLKNN